MSTGDWDNLQADIRNSLKIGQANGETLIDVVTRIVWLERHKNQIRIAALNEILRGVNGESLPERRPPVKAVDIGESLKEGIQVLGTRLPAGRLS
jgi:hypothetical protein